MGTKKSKTPLGPFPKTKSNGAFVSACLSNPFTM